jgi:hypothetical protein
LQLGKPPPNAGFHGERPPWTSVLDQCPHWLDKSGDRDSEGKTDDGSGYGAKE